MYTFVFLWTPALSPNGEKVAHGMIFACFMMSCMAGSTIAGRLLSDSKRYAVSHYMKVPLCLTLPLRRLDALLLTLGPLSNRYRYDTSCKCIRDHVSSCMTLKRYTVSHYMKVPLCLTPH